MRDIWVALAIAIPLVLTLAPDVEAQNVDQIKLAVTQGKSQTTTIGQPFPVRFGVRLTDDQGLPFVGAPVAFGNDGCVILSAGWATPCPFTGGPGHFEPGGTGTTVLTDSSGLAVAPPYIAGDNPGTIGVYAFALPRVAPYYIDYSPSLNHIVTFELTEMLEPVSVPSLSTQNVFALVLIILLAGCFVFRSRNVG